MWKLNLNSVWIRDIVWPGTHDSATVKMGIPLLTRPLAWCQECSIYNQLVRGTRVLDIWVEAPHRVFHEVLKSYKVDLVIRDIKRFLSETKSEFLTVEVRTEYGHQDPTEMEKWLTEQLGDYLIDQDNHVFDKTLAELLPKRVIFLWKPETKGIFLELGYPLWSSAYLKSDLIDIDLPLTKFKSNLSHLGSHPPVLSREYFYSVVCVKPVSNRIIGYARLFISQMFKKGHGDRLQILSCDFIDGDFIHAFIGITRARIEGRA
ncbi:hypothetical protein SUGI_0729960 [Cryptomeria japonica]|uniref:uncharacterized protein LOC131040006 n=1 Tax=Cryptomeria japonica TaxID=3369 RepID=UPI0024147103|nr:uncharacterized protein LOC131040006 [Cryptomeria japonica]GLJ36364.1 hypothetical protein SUGI_0729960 [Cryptomeria japonica]